MSDQQPNEQDQRRGGYGDSTGGQNPDAAASPDRATSAGGRDANVTDPIDSDEALGNRTGGYGGNPASTADRPASGSGAG